MRPRGRCSTGHTLWRRCLPLPSNTCSWQKGSYDPRLPCYRLLPSQSPNAPSRVPSSPLETHRPGAVTRWGDGGTFLGRRALRALVEKPVSRICRPSPHHLAMPPRRSCAAESYSAGAKENPADEGPRRPSPCFFQRRSQSPTTQEDAGPRRPSDTAVGATACPSRPPDHRLARPLLEPASLVAAQTFFQCRGWMSQGRPLLRPEPHSHPGGATEPE